MKIIIKTKNLKLNQALKNFIEEKINSLEKFCFFGSPTQIPPLSKKERDWEGKGKPRVEAWVEIGRTTLHHKKGPVFWAECQMHLPGKSIRSTAQSKDLKLSIVEVKDELQRELKEYKEKLTAKTKRRRNLKI